MRISNTPLSCQKLNFLNIKFTGSDSGRRSMSPITTTKIDCNIILEFVFKLNLISKAHSCRVKVVLIYYILYVSFDVLAFFFLI